MKKIYHLSNCSTCQRIIRELNDGEGFELQDIKTQPLTEADLDLFKEAAGSYEALFSRRAMKYRSMGLKDRNLSEEEYKQLILQEYTFLKRPVIVIGDRVFVGSSKKTVAAVKDVVIL